MGLRETVQGSVVLSVLDTEEEDPVRVGVLGGRGMGGFSGGSYCTAVGSPVYIGQRMTDTKPLGSKANLANSK